MPINQQARSVAIATPLGEDVMAIKRLVGTEQLGCLFEFEVELLSEDHTIAYDDILGQNATVRLEVAGGETRFFNGYIRQFSQLEPEGEYGAYRATLVPWMWFLKQASDCRIFQEKTVPDVIEEVFKAQGFDQYELRLSGSYESREYCVQYRETDFDFVSRLMEQEGIYYFFLHENGSHKLILADSASAHEPCPGYDEVDYRPTAREGTETECILDWSVQLGVYTGNYAVNAFDFKKPNTGLLAQSNIERQHAAAGFQQYEYGADQYVTSAVGEQYAKVHIEEIQSRQKVFSAETDARGLVLGHIFSMVKHFRDEQNRKYLITRIEHTITSDIVPGSDEDLYKATIKAIEDDAPFRAPRSTRRSIVDGPQTAVVVGPSGEEIHTDEHGRVKVQLHWDRDGKYDENSSCWLRVSQNWAGKSWGFFFLPRIGQEVIVEFLEGDPDRPIVTGSVYNGEAKPPYALPANKTMSTIKSNSSKGGAGFNEFRFEDKKGEEQVFLHAEKNQDIRVKNDTYEWIGNNRHLIVTKDQNEKVENDRNEEVVRDHVEKIGRDHHLAIEGKEAIKVTGSHSLVVDDDVIEEFNKNHSEQVTDDYYLKATNIVIEATDNITIKVGDSYIAIESSGIKIGTTGDIELEATGNITQTATANWEVEATAEATINGTAGLTLESPAITVLKGSLVQIN